jgi:hypothetical protein
VASVAATSPETLDRRPPEQRGRSGIAAFGVYVLLAFLYFGLGPLIEPGRQYVGVFDDPQIPIWSFAWWVHAISHGENPLYTHSVWAPTGVDLAWVNTVPAIAVAFAPLTALVGPVASYDVAAVLLPALSAWTGFLLCRHLVGRFWPALVGGYLFGFSSYVLGHVLGQPQLTAVFAVPLIALTIVRRLEAQISRNRMIVELGLLLALQLWLSAELALTLTIAIVLALVVGFAVAPPYRHRLVALLPPAAVAYLIAAVLAAPLLYYAVSSLRVAGFQPPGAYRADLLNFVIPTHLEAVGAGWAHRIALHFPGNSTEQGVFLGLPVLAIVVLYARRSWRTLAGRFLLVALAVAAYLSLGPKLTVDGHAVLPLPTFLGHERLSVPGLGGKFLPLFDNILPVRFALYTSLAAAVIVAVWMAATRSGVLRWLLPGLAVLLLVPNPGAGVWATTFSVPRFFTGAVYRSCLSPNENVLPQPVGQGGQSTLWQALDGFRYRLAGGRLQTSPPSVFLHPDTIAQISVGYDPVPNQAALLKAYFEAKHVTSVIVDRRQAARWTPALDRIARGQDVGGVILYHVTGSKPARC